MVQFIDILKTHMEKQGLSLVLLVIMVYYLGDKVTSLEEKIEKCNYEVITLLKDRNMD